jgi:hypothetical protein
MISAMPTRILLSALAAAAAAISLAATAAPASAALGSCPSNRLCFWFNSDYAGARADFAISDGSLANELFNDGPAGANGWKVQVEDNAASVANRTGEYVSIYLRRRCETLTASDAATLRPGEEFNLAHFGLKNKVSSLYVHDGSDRRCVNVDSNGY